MFAVGDKVLYRGRGILPKNVALVVNRLNGDYIGLEGYRIRYKNTSFVKEDDAPEVKKLSLLESLCQQVDNKGVGTCSYALEFTNGERRYQVKDICHARLNFGRYYDNHKVGLVLSSVALNIKGHLKGLSKEQTEEYKRFVEYILHRSPWRFAFLEETKANALESGVLLDVTKGINYCASAAIALRSASEFPIKRKVFNDLVDMFVSEHHAFILSALAEPGFKDTGPYIANFSGGHHVIVGTHDFKQLLAYFEKDKPYEVNAGKPYKDACGGSYRVWSSLAQSERVDERSLYKAFEKQAEKLLVKVKTGWNEVLLLPVKDNLSKIAICFMKAAMK